MHRVLFEVGGVKIYSYGLLVLLGFFAAFLFARRRAERYGFTKTDIADASFWTLLIGILGARIAYILQELPYYREHQRELWSIQFQGLTSFGGLLAGGIFLVLFARRRNKPVLALLDVASAPALLGHAIGRLGCLLNGCCYGPPCNDGLCVLMEVSPGHFERHQPAQIYDALMTLAAIGIMLLIERRRLALGKSFAMFLISYGVVRFIYEFWRAGVTSTYLDATPITVAQAVALAMALAGATLFFVSGKKNRTVNSGSKESSST